MTPDTPLVLIVDDNSTNIDLLFDMLKKFYRIGVAKTGVKALDYAGRHIPDLILLDIIMPGMNGFEVCSRLKEESSTKDIPVIFITGMTETVHKAQGFKLGAVDYITKPFHAAEVEARVRAHISLNSMRRELNSQNIILEQKVREKTAELRKMLEATVLTMAMMVEVRDPYTAGHQQRVARLAAAIAEKMALSKDQLDAIRLAGILHDIGKIRIPDSIINRPGKLLDVEFEMLRIHPQVGYDIMGGIPTPWPVADIIHQHHERLDGSGYPKGLHADDIMVESKILAVADVTEAMSSHRPYRPALGIDKAMDELMKKKGVWYDPAAVDACREVILKDGFVVN